MTDVQTCETNEGSAQKRGVPFLCSELAWLPITVKIARQNHG